MFYAVVLKSEVSKNKAYRLSLVAWEDVQYGVLPSAALLEHDHSALLLIKLKRDKREARHKQLQLLFTFLYLLFLLTILLQSTLLL